MDTSNASQKSLYLWCMERCGQIKRSRVPVSDNLSFEELKKLSLDSFGTSIGDNDFGNIIVLLDRLLIRNVWLQMIGLFYVLWL